MRDLAVVLSRPGQAVPALELVAAAGGPPAAATGPVSAWSWTTKRGGATEAGLPSWIKNSMPRLGDAGRVAAACGSGETAASNANADADLDRRRPPDKSVGRRRSRNRLILTAARSVRLRLCVPLADPLAGHPEAKCRSCVEPSTESQSAVCDVVVSAVQLTICLAEPSIIRCFSIDRAWGHGN